MRRSAALLAITTALAAAGAGVAGGASIEEPPGPVQEAVEQPAGDPAASTPPSTTVDLQILALNDFHGNLQSPGNLTIDGAPKAAGGADALAAALRQAEATNPNTVTVSAGDLIGASPLISALFHDEPTIEAMDLIGLDYNAVGNHEFDEGADELLRMQFGGCHPVDGCADGDGFAGAGFEFLAANVVEGGSGQTLFPPYGIARLGGVNVAFVGMTLEGTPDIVSPSGVAGLEFRDEADTVNALVEHLEKRADVIVVLVHEGGFPSAPDFDSCPGLSGPIVDIVERTSDAVDLFITGHTHNAYNCVVDGRPVTSSLSFGRLYTDIDVTYDTATGTVARIDVENVPVLRDGAPAQPDVEALLAKYDAASAPLRNRVIGAIEGDLLRAPNDAGESVLGDVIADAQLAATADPATGGAVAAFMNPGGIRADLLAAPSAGGEAAGEITYGEAFTVQPFGNGLTTMTLTGAQLDQLLEQQWLGQTSPRILQVSDGFSYTWDPTAPDGERVDPATITIGGTPVDPAASYRITVNSFLADGGDGFAVLEEGTDRLAGVQDLDAFEQHLEANRPLATPLGGRIRTTAG